MCLVPFHSSHGNSEKKHERQVLVAEDIARQLGEKETAENIMGVMIESHLVAGTFPLTPRALCFGDCLLIKQSRWVLTFAFPLGSCRQTINPSRRTREPRLRPVGHGRLHRLGHDRRDVEQTPGWSSSAP